MRKFILPAFAVATVVILAGAAVAQGPGGALSSPPNYGPVTPVPTGPYHTNMPMLPDPGPSPGGGLRGPMPGTNMPMLPGAPSSAQIQVFGPMAVSRGSRPMGAMGPPGARGFQNRGSGAPQPMMFRGVGR